MMLAESLPENVICGRDFWQDQHLAELVACLWFHGAENSGLR